jgi:hypothetical protein
MVTRPIGQRAAAIEVAEKALAETAALRAVVAEPVKRIECRSACCHNVAIRKGRVRMKGAQPEGVKIRSDQFTGESKYAMAAAVGFLSIHVGRRCNYLLVFV